jgi:hypothetical protein
LASSNLFFRENRGAYGGKMVISAFISEDWDFRTPKVKLEKDWIVPFLGLQDIHAMDCEGCDRWTVKLPATMICPWSTIVIFGRSSEFAEYHESTISGSVDDGLRLIGLVDGRIRDSQCQTIWHWMCIPRALASHFGGVGGQKLAEGTQKG